MTKEEFIAGYCSLSGITREKFDAGHAWARDVVLELKAVGQNES